MATRVPDRSAGGRARDEPPEAERPGEAARPDDQAVQRDAVEREKARTETAAGDVADDLADFA